MPKKREAALFLAALLIAMLGAAAWRALTRVPATVAPSVAAPESMVRTALGDLFSRPPAPAYAPVDAPAMSAPEPTRFGERPEKPSEPWAGTTGAEYSMGESGGGAGRGGGSLNSASSGAGAAPQWQIPTGGGQSAAAGGWQPPPQGVAAPPSGAADSSNAGAASAAPISRRALGGLERRAARSERVDVDLTPGSGGGIASPTASVFGAPPAATDASPTGAPAAVAAAAPPPDGSAALGSAAGGADAGAGDAPSAAPSAAPDAPTATAADDGTGGDPSAQQIADVTPAVGSPQVSNGNNGVVVTPSGFFFAAKKGGGQTVQLMTIAGEGVKGVEFTSALHVDSNGAGGWYKKTKTGRATTSLKYSKTESLNPGKIPYIVVPKGFRGDYPDVRLGDYAAVTYGGKTLYAIIGDVGPPGVIGAGSIDLAAGLGMTPTTKGGGVPGGVTYVILAGSRDARPPRDAAAIQSEGKQLFERAGIPVN